MEWEKIFARHVSDKRQVSKIKKNSHDSVAKIYIIRLKNGQRA